MDSQIEHVSDTALMVAACRAIETEREDGRVRDPFAARLAGERGMAIAGSRPFLDLMSFVVGVRAHIMDEIILKKVGSGEIETVANLGAGLDTRPWRLELPPTLRWIEADFEAILAYKHGRLHSELPRCRLERISADLASPEARARVFELVGPGPALMMTEGLLMYLPKAGFMSIAQDAVRLSGIRYWLFDAASLDSFRRMTGGGENDAIARLRPADHLQGQALLDAAQETGWKLNVARLYRPEFAAMSAARIAELVEALQKAGNPQPPREDLSGVYLFSRTAG